MKITINSRDLPYTIDTYGMFDGESSEEGEAQYYLEEYGIEGHNVDFDYDHKGIVGDLATASVDILESELIGDIVKSITLVPDSGKSPQFYNYTTDSYMADWDIDEAKLLATIDAKALQAYQLESSWGLLDDQSEDYIVSALDFYLQGDDTPLTVDDYNMQMWERENEIYYENCKPSAEMQKLIDAKESEK